MLAHLARTIWIVTTVRNRARYPYRRLLRWRGDELFPRPGVAGARPSPRPISRVSRPHEWAAYASRERTDRRLDLLRSRHHRYADQGRDARPDPRWWPVV